MFSPRTSVAALTAAAATFTFSTISLSQAAAPAADPPQPPAVAQHVAKAKQIAGNDPLLADMASKGYWCMSPSEGVKYRAVPSKDPAAPLQAFDNFYIFGTGYVSSYVLKTSAGSVMWDALDNENEVKTILEPGMKQFGLNPADVKFLILTHGHGDHFGGAKYLQDTYHMPVGLSGPDWQMMATAPARPGAPEPPKKDQVLTDGQKITIGDATIEIVLTPGHTPSTVSSIAPVKDHGKTHVMALWGGTAYPATMAGLNEMRKSIQHFKDAAKAANADGILNTHGFFYNINERVNARGSAADNPLVIGATRLQKTMDIKAECLEAMSAWYVAMGKGATQ